MRLKKNVRKALAGALAGAAIITASVAGTVAYLTDGKSLTNTLKPANDTVRIVEQFPTPEPPAQGENTYKKNVKIENNGDTPAYVRAYIGFSDNRASDNAQVTADGTYRTWAQFLGGTGIPQGWTYVPETDSLLGGFFYYTEALAPGQSTPSLTDSFKVTFATADDVIPFEIIVYTESVSTLDRDGNTTFTASLADGTVSASDPAWKKAWKEHLSSVAR